MRINPKITIIIPVLNNLKGLQKTLDSIKAQIFKDFEVWIIDGNSSKDTQDFLSKLKAPFFYKSQNDKGIYDAMNSGIIESKGEWLIFLGSGDELATDRTLKLISDEFKNDTILLVGQIEYKIKNNNNKLFKSKWSFLMWLKNTVHHQSIIYNKSVFKEKLYLNDYKILSDYDFNLRLYKHKIKVRYLDSIIALCESHGVSKSYTWILYKEELALKTSNSSILLKPVFSLLCIVKFLIRKYF